MHEYGISTLLPVFFRDDSRNQIEELKRAIISVIDQEYPTVFELIVIDDGSITSVEKVIKSKLNLKYPFIRYIRLSRNFGLQYALNVGLASAKYPYIARIDSDDEWLKGKIAKQVEFFSQNQDLTIVGTGMAIRTVDGKIVSEHIRPDDWQGIIKFFIEVGCPFPHGSILGKIDIFKLLGGYPMDSRVTHAEDFALWSTWLRFFKPAIIKEVLYYYTASQSSVTSIHTQRHHEASSFVHGKFLELPTTLGIPRALSELSQVLGLSLMDIGKLFFLAWKYGGKIFLPEDVLENVKILMPDRRLILREPWNRIDISYWRTKFPGITDSNLHEKLVEVEIVNIPSSFVS